MAGRVAKWDTELGYRLYLEGRSDGEIADECKVKTATVTSYRLKRWRRNPDGGRTKSAACRGLNAECPPASENAELSPLKSELERKEVAEVSEDKKHDVDRMMEVIAKMTSGMGGIKAVCVGNIIQSLWNLNCVDDIRNARNILDWLEANYDFG